MNPYKGHETYKKPAYGQYEQKYEHKPYEPKYEPKPYEQKYEAKPYDDYQKPHYEYVLLHKKK